MKLAVCKSKLIKELLGQEDTNSSNTITIDDNGLKRFEFVTTNGDTFIIDGTYHLSNVLQETALLKEEIGAIDLKYILEKPTDRISRLIKEYYWDMLTRNINKEGLLKVLEDDKMKGDFFRLYVPEKDKKAINFYKDVVEDNKFIKVVVLPSKISSSYIDQIHSKPGILSLGIDENTGNSLPFVVPGGRFNEMYGWDSYFIAVGLIIDGKYELVKGIIENLEYQILNYGKILNANRSYYLTRSQPPFFSTLIRDFYEKYSKKLDLKWLDTKLTTCLIEYNEVWMNASTRLTSTGLNRFFGEGKGIPPETEKGHFNFILKSFAQKYGHEVDAFEKEYQNGTIEDSEADSYFVHDRSMRESGHDTTSRLDDISADLNTVDLNALLYKYETDIAYLIKTYFNDCYLFRNESMNSMIWFEKSEARKKRMLTLMWDEESSTFFDFNLNDHRKQPFYSATNLYPLWAKLCTQEEADKIIKNHLPKYICKGGISSTSREVIAEIKQSEVKRQWDYPYGWAPHQMLIWQGLLNYGYSNLAQELIYRWLWLMVKTVVNYNGLIPEKFNVNECTHKVNVEYGNVGTAYKYVPDGGFGWTNASYKLGLDLLDTRYIDDLNNLKDPDLIFK